MIKKILFLYDRSERYTLLVLLFFSLLSIILELLGISAIIPIIATISKPELINQNDILSSLYRLSGSTSINQFIIIMSVVLFFIYLIKNIILAAIQYFRTIFFLKKDALLSNEMFTSYLFKPYDFHLKNNTAELFRNIGPAVTSFTSGLCMQTLIAVSESILLLSIIILLLLVDFNSTIIMVFFIGIVSVFFYRFIKKRLLKLGEKQQILATLVTQNVIQGLGSIKELKILGREKYFSDYLEKLLADKRKVFTLNELYQFSPRYLFEVLSVLIIVVYMGLSISYGVELKTMVVKLSVFAIASFRIIPSVTRLMQSLSQIRFSLPSLDIVYKDYQKNVLSDNYKKSNNISKIDNIGFTKSITLKNVVFKYPTSETYSVYDISLKIDKE